MLASRASIGALRFDGNRSVTERKSDGTEVCWDRIMKLAGFLLLVAGWAIVAAAVALLPSTGVRVVFVLAGIAVELFGLALAFRSHLVLQAEPE